MMNNMSSYSSIIHKSRYARWIEGENRRESWEETVDRYINFMYKTVKNTDASTEVKHELYLLLGATCDE